jgi:16S rRNA (uracil1498-N3)-methyltransferase
MYKYPRLYLADPIQQGQVIALKQNQSHYLLNVLRMKDGAIVRIFNGHDGEWLATIHPQSKKHANLSPTEQIKPQISIEKRVHLLFAPIKKQRMDFLVEKSVELGVTDLHPILTQNTEVRKVNEDRINAQIIEAAEQCERLDLPTLHPLNTLDKKCATWDSNTPLLAAIERQESPHISTIKHDGDIGFLIGPEGGFTQEEAQAIVSISSITPVDLGARILRAETAALYGLSILV